MDEKAHRSPSRPAGLGRSLVAGAPKVWKERLVSHLERRNAA